MRVTERNHTPLPAHTQKKRRARTSHVPQQHLAGKGVAQGVHLGVLARVERQLQANDTGVFVIFAVCVEFGGVEWVVSGSYRRTQVVWGG